MPKVKLKCSKCGQDARPNLLRLAHGYKLECACGERLVALQTLKDLARKNRKTSRSHKYPHPLIVVRKREHKKEVFV